MRFILKNKLLKRMLTGFLLFLLKLTLPLFKRWKLFARDTVQQAGEKRWEGITPRVIINSRAIRFVQSQLTFSFGFFLYENEGLAEMLGALIGYLLKKEVIKQVQAAAKELREEQKKAVELARKEAKQELSRQKVEKHEKRTRKEERKRERRLKKEEKKRQKALEKQMKKQTRGGGDDQSDAAHTASTQFIQTHSSNDRPEIPQGEPSIPTVSQHVPPQPTATEENAQDSSRGTSSNAPQPHSEGNNEQNAHSSPSANAPQQTQQRPSHDVSQPTDESEGAEGVKRSGRDFSNALQKAKERGNMLMQKFKGAVKKRPKYQRILLLSSPGLVLLFLGILMLVVVSLPGTGNYLFFLVPAILFLFSAVTLLIVAFQIERRFMGA